MKSTKILTSIILLSTIFISVSNIGFVLAGYENDPTGDASGINGCDITRVDVEVTYHSHPVDDEINLKITLLEAPLMDENHTVRYDYNFFVDTSLSTNSNTTDLWGTGGEDIYEYRAHLTCRWVSDTWVNESYLYCSRYYLNSEGGTKNMGTFYWNPNTETWVASNPGLEVGQVIGNTIQWDVTGAIYREVPIGTGYVVQGVANAAYGLVVRDYATESGWVDEFDNLCAYPSNTPSNTPSLPGIGFFFSVIFMSLFVASIYIYRKKK